jgi:hypothetical protein
MKPIDDQTYHIDHIELIPSSRIKKFTIYTGASMLISLKKKEDIFATQLTFMTCCATCKLVTF